MVDGELWLWCNFTVWVLARVLSCLMTHGGSPGNMAGQQHGAVSPTIGRLVGWWVGGLVEIFTSLDVYLQTIEDRSECILKTSLCYCAKNKKSFTITVFSIFTFMTFMAFSFFPVQSDQTICLAGKAHLKFGRVQSFESFYQPSYSKIWHVWNKHM